MVRECEAVAVRRGFLAQLGRDGLGLPLEKRAPEVGGIFRGGGSSPLGVTVTVARVGFGGVCGNGGVVG